MTPHTHIDLEITLINIIYLFVFLFSPSSSGLTRVMRRLEEVVEDRREILLLGDITRLPGAR